MRHPAIEHDGERALVRRPAHSAEGRASVAILRDIRRARRSGICLVDGYHTVHVLEHEEPAAGRQRRHRTTAADQRYPGAAWAGDGEVLIIGTRWRLLHPGARAMLRSTRRRHRPSSEERCAGHGGERRTAPTLVTSCNPPLCVACRERGLDCTCWTAGQKLLLLPRELLYPPGLVHHLCPGLRARLSPPDGYRVSVPDRHAKARLIERCIQRVAPSVEAGKASGGAQRSRRSMLGGVIATPARGGGSRWGSPGLATTVGERAGEDCLGGASQPAPSAPRPKQRPKSDAARAVSPDRPAALLGGLMICCS